MRDDYTTNSHYLTYTFLFRKVGRMYILNVEVKGYKGYQFVMSCDRAYHGTSNNLAVVWKRLSCITYLKRCLEIVHRSTVFPDGRMTGSLIRVCMIGSRNCSGGYEKHGTLMRLEVMNSVHLWPLSVAVVWVRWMGRFLAKGRLAAKFASREVIARGIQKAVSHRYYTSVEWCLFGETVPDGMKQDSPWMGWLCLLHNNNKRTLEYRH